MNITTFAPTTYKEHKIYVRNFGTHFEYLTIIKGEIYTAHLTIRPDLKNRVLYWLGFQKLPYSQEQLNATCHEVAKIAEITIDNIYFKS